METCNLSSYCESSRSIIILNITLHTCYSLSRTRDLCFKPILTSIRITWSSFNIKLQISNHYHMVHTLSKECGRKVCQNINLFLSNVNRLKLTIFSNRKSIINCLPNRLKREGSIIRSNLILNILNNIANQNRIFIEKLLKNMYLYCIRNWLFILIFCSLNNMRIDNRSHHIIWIPIIIGNYSLLQHRCNLRLNILRPLIHRLE